MPILVDYRSTEAPNIDDFILVFKQEKIFLDKEQILPRYSNLVTVLAEPKWMLRVGYWQDRNCYLYLGDVKKELTDLALVAIRSQLSHTDFELQSLLHRANHLNQWHRDSRFCGRCGKKLQFMTSELGKICTGCESIQYPRINPCIIVAITRQDSILLAEISRNNRSFYSVLAGYAEIGENLEQCVVREVREEVGIEVKNIQYFASQAWSFSQSLMVAFVAEYDNGEIQADGVEIRQAAWYQKDNLPDLPPHFSVARELIEWFRNK